MNWHCIELSREEHQTGELDILKGAFHAAWIARNGPRGMALFGLWSEDGLSYRVYASPASERHLRPILDAYSARQQDPPRDRRGLEFICGDEAGVSVLVC